MGVLQGDDITVVDTLPNRCDMHSVSVEGVANNFLALESLHIALDVMELIDQTIRNRG